MKPKGYLTFLTKRWDLIAELFDLAKEGPMDQVALVQTIRSHHPETNVTVLIEKLLSHDVITQILSGQTLYNLGYLTEQIVENLLNEQQLGLSESIIVHLKQFDELSSKLLHAVENRELDLLIRCIKKINRQTQAVKAQALHNYKAIQNIVAESNKKSTIIPLKQRYADVLETWDHYITPMGELIDPWGAFDANTDQVVVRLERAADILDKTGVLISEQENVHMAKHMVVDMKAFLIQIFRLSREILQPLYEVARLNSKVTRGTSVILEYARKNKFKVIEKTVTLEWFFKARSPLLSNDIGLLKFFAGFKDIKENPAPPISIVNGEERAKSILNRVPPLNRYAVLNDIRSNLPITDAVQWAIEKYPAFSTGKILDIILLMMTEKTLKIKTAGSRRYQTKTHVIEGLNIGVENYVHQ
jgi:hypothetical protein